MTFAEEAASVGLPNLLRSDRPDGEARSLLFASNLPAWRPLRFYSLDRIRRRWKYLALALGRRDEVARVTQTTIDGPAGSIRLRLYSPEGGGELRPGLVWLHGPRTLKSCRPRYDVSRPHRPADRLLFSTTSAQTCRRSAIDSGGFRRSCQADLPAGLGRTFDADDRFGRSRPGCRRGGRPSGVRGLICACRWRGLARHHGIGLPRRLVVSFDD